MTTVAALGSRLAVSVYPEKPAPWPGRHEASTGQTTKGRRCEATATAGAPATPHEDASYSTSSSTMWRPGSQFPPSEAAGRGGVALRSGHHIARVVKTTCGVS